MIRAVVHDAGTRLRYRHCGRSSIRRALIAEEFEVRHVHRGAHVSTSV